MNEQIQFQRRKGHMSKTIESMIDYTRTVCFGWCEIFSRIKLPRFGGSVGLSSTPGVVVIATTRDSVPPLEIHTWKPTSCSKIRFSCISERLWNCISRIPIFQDPLATILCSPTCYCTGGYSHYVGTGSGTWLIVESYQIIARNISIWLDSP